MDSNCTVPAESVDPEIKAAIDVANSVSAHSTNQCGVIGHLFPFHAPFGYTTCNATHIELRNYENYRCTIQKGEAQAYPWGQCREIYPSYPNSMKGIKFVRFYPTK